MIQFTATDGLHRLEKLLLENGTAKSAAEANAILASYRMQFVVGPELQESAALQVALLTAVNTARRAIHGDVDVVGDVLHPLTVPVPGCDTVEEAVRLFGGTIRSEPSSAHALLFGSPTPPSEVIALRVTVSGWRGGVVPADEHLLTFNSPGTTLAGAVAGAVGVSELFQAMRGVNARAGRRSIGYSAWAPEADWLLEESDGPELEHLPSAVWIIGLGHLGQSLLWNLAFLPYVDPTAIRVVLQDFDVVKRANVSTSPLTFVKDERRMKTRVMAEWAEGIGLQTRLVERAFAPDFELNRDEPLLAFCGVDNIQARAALEHPGFDAVVEAGLGTGEEYHAFQLHTFPGPIKARDRWANRRAAQLPGWSDGLERFAAEAGLDECGRSELAGLQVASSFVGVLTTALAIGQMLRPLHGAPMHGSVSGTLGSSITPTAIPGQVGAGAVRFGSLQARRPHTAKEHPRAE